MVAETQRVFFFKFGGLDVEATGGKKTHFIPKTHFCLSFHDGLFVLCVTKAGNMGRFLVFYSSRDKKPDFSLPASDGRNVVDPEKIHVHLLFFPQQ